MQAAVTPCTGLVELQMQLPKCQCGTQLQGGCHERAVPNTLVACSSGGAHLAAAAAPVRELGGALGPVAACACKWNTIPDAKPLSACILRCSSARASHSPCWPPRPASANSLSVKMYHHDIYSTIELMILQQHARQQWAHAMALDLALSRRVDTRYMNHQCIESHTALAATHIVARRWGDCSGAA